MLSGTANAGRTLTCLAPAFTGTGTVEYAYTWLRNGTPIADFDKGDTGPKGDTGGPKGDAGAAGPAGPRGDRGPAGPT